VSDIFRIGLEVTAEFVAACIEENSLTTITFEITNTY
jgi:hypothetical protein